LCISDVAVEARGNKNVVQSVHGHKSKMFTTKLLFN
jgi:hypothetical protein